MTEHLATMTHATLGGPSADRGLVYLAGPIAGHSYDEATRWRREWTQLLSAYGIRALSPMRAKEHLDGAERIENDAKTFGHYLARPEDILARDKSDCTRADVVVFNMLYAASGAPNTGTMIEVGWASALGKPLVTIIDDMHPLLAHPLFGELTRGFRTDSEAQALYAVRTILGVG